MDNDSSRPNRWPVRVLLALAAMALLACLCVYLFLPELATGFLSGEQIRQMGFADFHGRITRIGPFQAAGGPFLFGHADHPAVSVHSVEIDYTPGGLMRRHIGCLRLSDLTVNGRLQSGRLVLPGLQWSRSNRPAPAEPMANRIPGTIGKIEIRSARLFLEWENEIFRIPFDADIRPRNGDLTRLDVRVGLYLGDQRLSITACLDLEKDRGDLAMDGAAIRLDGYAGLFHRLSGTNLSGLFDLNVSADFRMNPPALSDARIKVVWHRGSLSWGALSIFPQGTETGAVFSAVSADGIKWQVEAGGLHMPAPVPVAVTAIRGTMDLGGEGPVLDGQVDLSILPFFRRCPLAAALSTELPLSLTFGMHGEPSGRWTANCQTIADNSSALPPAELTVEGARIACHAPRLQLDIDAENQRVEGRWQMEIGPMDAALSGMQASLSAMQGSGTVRFGTQGAEAFRSGEARLSFPEARVSGNGLSGGSGAVSLSARFHQEAGRLTGLSGRLQVNDGRLRHNSSRVDLSGIRLDLPYASDPETNRKPGLFSISRIGQGHLNLGGLVGRIIPGQDSLVLSAGYHSALLPKMTAAIRGRLKLAGETFPDASLEIDLPDYDLPECFDPGHLLPDLEGVCLSGTVAAQGRVSFSANRLNGRLDLDCKGGRLDMADRGLTVEGIDGALHFPQLPSFRSGPAQTLAFRRAKLGQIVVDGGRFDFQVESPDTVFVEKGRLQWCGGIVDAQSLRLTAGRQTYALSLYCQRLSLSRILEQLGAVNARGSGTVNGRIPVTYNKGRIRFDDGFLFSTPGEPGKIRLTNTDILTRGILAGTPQFAQVDLAREALKDYDYQWAKLGINTEDETLVMRLQFDGKPAGALPFVFQREIGSFARVTAGEQGSIFQGIALDVNLRLPLDRLLEYKGVVDMLD